MRSSQLHAIVPCLAVLVSVSGCHQEPSTPPPPPPRLSDAQRTQLRAQYAALRAEADKEDSARRRATMIARRAQPGPGRCAVSAQDLFGEINLVLHPSSTLIVHVLHISELFLGGTLPKGPGTTRASIDEALLPFEQQLDGALNRPPEQFLGAARGVAPPPYVVSVVVDQFLQPTSIGNGTFESGALRGQIYLWSHAERRNICVAPIAGGNSESLTVKAWPPAGPVGEVEIGSALLGDLVVPAVARGAGELRPLPAP